MRLFIAVELPDEVKDYLFSLQREIGNSYARINWVHKKNLHLTIKFLGEVSNKKISEVKERLSKLKFDPVQVKTQGVGVFPSDSFIRVVWVGLEPKEGVIKLQQTVDEALLDLFPREQDFQAHLTLGRVKQIKNKEKFVNSLKDIDVRAFGFELNTLKLIKSELTRTGPNYEVIGEYC